MELASNGPNSGKTVAAATRELLSATRKNADETANLATATRKSAEIFEQAEREISQFIIGEGTSPRVYANGQDANIGILGAGMPSIMSDARRRLEEFKRRAAENEERKLREENEKRAKVMELIRKHPSSVPDGDDRIVLVVSDHDTHWDAIMKKSTRKLGRKKINLFRPIIIKRSCALWRSFSKKTIFLTRITGTQLRIKRHTSEA